MLSLTYKNKSFHERINVIKFYRHHPFYQHDIQQITEHQNRINIYKHVFKITENDIAHRTTVSDTQLDHFLYRNKSDFDLYENDIMKAHEHRLHSYTMKAKT